MTTDKALDLALEALEKISRTHYHIETPPIESLEEKMRRIADKAITAIKQARSAPVREPVAYEYGDDVFWHDSPDINDYIRANGKALVYTTPPAAQRQWVGLTLEQKQHLNEALNLQGRFPIIDAIESKLKEENGWYRQHVTDGSPCWCEPETSYIDPKTGASVIVHKEPQ